MRIVQKCINMVYTEEGWTEQDANERMENVKEWMNENGILIVIGARAKLSSHPGGV